MSAPLTFLTDDQLALAAPRRLRMLETSPITCIGGKGRGQVLHLAQFLPSRFGSFYEPFMGGMNMSNLLIKEGWISPNKCRASDQCKELVDFFVTLQTHAEPLAKALLADRQLHGSGSRELFAEARAAIAEAASRLSVARGFYLHNRMAFLGIRDFESANRYSPTLVASAGITKSHVLRLLLFAGNLAGVRIQETIEKHWARRCVMPIRSFSSIPRMTRWTSRNPTRAMIRRCTGSRSISICSPAASMRSSQSEVHDHHQ